MKTNLIKIASFTWTTEAHLLRTRLEAEGIPCYVFEENIVNLDWTLWDCGYRWDEKGTA